MKADASTGDRSPYTFVAAIAQGGMGTVELCCRREDRSVAWSPEGVRWAARKRLHPQLRDDPAFRAMFMDEARLAGLVRHPNVVSVSEVGDDSEGPYLIMDYVEGLSLSRVFRHAARDERLIPMQVAVRIGRDAARGLHAAHEVRAEDGSPLNLVHRDVSPQNVLIGFDGSVRVTDFGIAKALGNASQTTAGVLKGNMGYLSPEQLRFEEPDRRSDLFSLGVTLYELLSGERLYPNKAGFEGTRRILREPPPDIRAERPEVPGPLATLLLEMLSKGTTGRPSTALEVAARLESVLFALIAAEGNVIVADYMNQHFASARDRHRARLAEHLRNSQQGRRAPAALSQDGIVEQPVTKRERPTTPVKRRPWLSLGVAAATLGLVAFAGVRLTRPAPLAAAAPVQLASAAVDRTFLAGVEIVPLPPPVPPLPVEGPEPPPVAWSPPEPPPAPPPRATAKAARRVHASRHHRVTAPAGSRASRSSMPGSRR